MASAVAVHTLQEHEALSRAVQPLISDSTLAEASAEFQETGQFLWNTLRHAPLVQRVGRRLAHSEGAVPLKDLAQNLFASNDEEAHRAVLGLVRLAASARLKPDTPPLIPHRLHLMARAPNGLCVCLNCRCSVSESFRAFGLGALQPLAARCWNCQAVTLTVCRCKTCGLGALAGSEDHSSLKVSNDFAGDGGSRRLFVAARGLDDELIRRLLRTVINPANGELAALGDSEVELFRAPCPEHGTNCLDPICTRQMCPRCEVLWHGATETSQLSEERPTIDCAPLEGPQRLSLSILAETVLEGMPAFLDDVDSKHWKPGMGRRLLCFSDSRREAARLGPQLTRAHERWVIRAAIVDAAGELGSTETLIDIDEEIALIKSRLAALGPNEAGRRNRFISKLEAKESERQSALSGTPVHDFARFVGNNGRIEQIIDSDTSEKHNASRWNQRDWNENSREVRIRAEALVATELNRPLHTRVSLESIGLVEVSYPGLDQIPAPAIVLGSLPDNDVRQQIVTGLAGLPSWFARHSALRWCGGVVRTRHRRNAQVERRLSVVRSVGGAKWERLGCRRIRGHIKGSTPEVVHGKASRESGMPRGEH